MSMPLPRNPPYRLPSVRILAVMFALTLTACTWTRDGIGFYWQSARGQLELMRSARPVQTVIDDAHTPGALKERLQHALELRDFAVRELALPDNGSYRQYVELGRPAVLWNVVAAPELSLRLEQWCFPIAGCVTYRGYFDRAAAQGFADELALRGYDVQVAPVPAYSTLGWFDDPLLSSFIHQPDVELGRLIFHELAHQVAYVKGDSRFNESFATSVEQIGVERWLTRSGTQAQREAWRKAGERRTSWIALLQDYRSRLDALYRSALPENDKRLQKGALLEAMRRDYATMRDGAWGGYSGYDRWFAGPVGNAHLGAIATYTDWVPAFLALWREQSGDMGRYYARVRELARMSPTERRTQMEHLSGR